MIVLNHFFFFHLLLNSVKYLAFGPACVDCWKLYFRASKYNFIFSPESQTTFLLAQTISHLQKTNMKTCHWHCQHISSVVLSLPIIKKSYLTAPTGNQTQGLRPNVQYQCSGLMLWFNIPCLNGSGQSTGTLINCFNFMIIYDMYIQYFKYIFWYCLNINIFSLMTASSFEYL